MKFSRLANKYDFELALKQFEDIPEHAKTFIEIGRVLGGYKIWINNYNTYGRSNDVARKLCEEYASYLKALEDFENGEDIFVTY